MAGPETVARRLGYYAGRRVMAISEALQLAEARPSGPPVLMPRGQQVRFSQFQKWSEHPGFGLTVDKLLQAYRRAEDGDPAQQCDIFEDRIEADAHLRGIIDTRVDGVAKQTWTIMPGGETEEDKLAARLLERALRVCPNFTATRDHQLRANYFGWSASEIDWQRQMVEGKELAVPVWFENVPHRRFLFDERDRPRLRRDFGDIVGEELRPWKWWVTCRPGRITAAAGYMRTAAFWSHFKTMGVRDWLTLMDRFGLPYVTGEYNTETSPADKEALKQAVSNLGSDGWAVFSNACKLVIHQIENGGVSGAEGIHGAMVDLCDAQNSKLIAGATLVAESNGKSSYAIGTVHQARNFLLLKADELWLGESFEVQIGLPFVRFNGLNAMPPRLKAHLDLDIGVPEWVSMVSQAANELGLQVDEDQFRQRTLLRAPTGPALVGTKNKGGESDAEGAPADDKAA